MKIVRKLAGKSPGTAAWCTNVGNETGQVFMSVLTASEGAGLDPIATGLMRRYALAGVPPPEVLYVDRDCCGNKMQQMFSLWDGIVVRLDTWHFMRRITSGCTTEAHQLYGYFCGRLSRCIFQWSQLKLAKTCEMFKSGIINPTDDDVIKKITKKELALHCCRQTRGVEETERLYNLLETLSGEQGSDTMGVPLLDSDRIWEIWESQKRHIPCLQDPEGVQLYIRTGTLEKGDVLLPTYRCARGTTSLESFHKHIARFIQGESASDMHLLDGLMRWNADCAVDAVYPGCRPKDNPETYNALHTKALNTLSQEVLDLEDDEGFDEVEDETLENAVMKKDFAGPGNVQGYGQVQALAEYLVSLRGSDTMAISNSQAKDIVRMWNKLDAYDKKPTKFAPRHRTKLAKGKFKQPKKRSSIVIPGLDSTKRSFLGTSSGPAQWPDCNRYVEAIIIKLCDIHPVPEKSKKTVTSRWNLICQSYKDIRRKILNNDTTTAIIGRSSTKEKKESCNISM
ncbi:uncharacterized protein LOC114574708 [Exaiptasia diaphana]|uniref:Uncharacterized protein n=1 Tax=Exaiptasia diaphana TaxID=2652724 RepID=A0A913YES8_EXADI|nr:uncharacterized protein LOC114574708 [Exaiptasia diaphana]